MHKTTLEQWGLLDKVVQLGSFARAAEATNRSQSSVSYNLGLLHERLGVMLFKQVGRKAELTPVGEALLNQVRPLLRAFDYVEARAATLRNGARSRLDLVVDSIFPRSILFSILRQFQQRHPYVQVNLTEVLENEANNTDADIMVLTRRQDITGRGEWLMNIDFVAVAHRDHPLHQLNLNLSEEVLSQYPLIRIAEADAPPAQRLAATEYWTFSTFDAAIEAVLFQVGYGWLPEERIAGHLASGILKTLPLSHGIRRVTPLHLLIKKNLMPADEAVNTLLRLFKTTIGSQRHS
ncbi:LysR family transcriptional regulator [Brenneria goodwinii]|uniref:LysR family transcriptional regulator n=1 Tax=Brenneria goodwinii TaxID=1109412 RepID=UPI0036E7978B